MGEGISPINLSLRELSRIERGGRNRVVKKIWAGFGSQIVVEIKLARPLRRKRDRVALLYKTDQPGVWAIEDCTFKHFVKGTVPSYLEYTNCPHQHAHGLVSEADIVKMKME